MCLSGAICLARQTTDHACCGTSAAGGHIATRKRLKSSPHPPHSLRHTWMTFSLEAGVSIELAKLLMNHKFTDVTWSYITRANLLGPMREASEATVAKSASYRGG